jgi:hypothetical protein
MWGKGLYFAVNASYSHHYRRKHTDGTSGMFMAQVNVGQEIEIPFDQTN